MVEEGVVKKFLQNLGADGERVVVKVVGIWVEVLVGDVVAGSVLVGKLVTGLVLNILSNVGDGAGGVVNRPCVKC